MRAVCAIVACGAAFAAHGQETELHFTIETSNGTDWTLSAELYRPTATIRATIADLGFTITGENFSNFQYNSAFDSSFFGDADVTVSASQIDFIGGNTLPPLNNAGGPDGSNPLQIATFQADNVDSFDLVGQVTGAYVGSPFDEILFYQNADGSPGDTTWCYFWFCTPTPGTATAFGFGGAFLLRRRR